MLNLLVRARRCRVLTKAAGRAAVAARSWWPLWGLPACLAASGLAAPPPAAVLSPAAAGQEAVAHSPRVRAAEQAVAQARAEARAAGAWPALRLEASPLVSDQRGGDVEASLTQPLFDPLRAPSARAAQAALAAVTMDLEEVRLEVLGAARAAYYRLAVAERQALAVAQDVALARALRDAAAKAREVGERPGVDVLRADLELSLTEQAAAEALAEAAQARANLAGLLGRDSRAPLTVETNLALAVPSLDAAALHRQAASRPRLRSAALRVEQRRRLVAVAGAQRSPAVELQGFREDQEHGLRVSVSLPLLDHGRVRAEVEAAAAAERGAEHELAAAQREVDLAVEQARLAAEAALQRRTRYAADVLARAERLAELTRLGYQAGEMTLLDGLDARRRLAEARRQTVSLDQAVIAALLELQRAVGTVLLELAPAAPTPVPVAAVPATAAAVPRTRPGGLDYGPPVPATGLRPRSLIAPERGAP